MGLKKQIQFLMKNLGKYSFESSMIYLNSLLRSSILFAAEAMYNVKEIEYRHIERIKEDMMRKKRKIDRKRMCRLPAVL